MIHSACLIKGTLLTLFTSILTYTELSAGNILRGGWAEISIPSIDGFKISFADSLHGWIVSQNGDIIYTSDAGTTWEPRHCPAEILDAELVSDHVGWVRPSVPIGGDTILYRSTDAGLSWTILRLPGLMFFAPCQSASFISDSVVYIAFDSLSATTDGGLTWSRRGSLRNVAGPNIGFFNADVGYAGNALAGSIPGATLLKTTDGGFSWSTIEHYIPDYIGSFGPFRFFNGKLGCYDKDIQPEIGPPFATLAMTWNCGNSWIGIWNQPATYTLGMTPDSLHQWLLRYTGSIQRTTDGGATWESDTLPVPIADILYDLHGHQFAFGAGRLFRYDSTLTGITQLPLSPTEIVLFQNYPNPFNPTTNFQFTIDNRQLTILRVYDLLGREVVTLVNEVKAPGTYAVQWKPDNLASGIYIARLEAGGQVQSRKLLLLR